MSFGKEIKRLKEKSKMSAGTLATALGVDAERLRKWMQKDLNPREEDVRAIEENTGMSIEEIMALESLPDFQNVPNKLFSTNNAKGMILENQIEMLAIQRVILSALCEIQAPLMKEKTLPTHLLSIYRKMVKDEAVQVRSELKLKS